MKNAIIIVSVALFSILHFNCGIYGFRGNNPPEGIKSVAVPLFIDNSGFSQAGLKEDFTTSLKNKILSDNTFSLLDKDKSDGVLNCTINTIRDEAMVISGNEVVSKRKITISINVEFMNMRKHKKIWERKFENWGDYNSSNSSFSQRTEGIKLAIDKITEDIINDITSNW